MTNRRDFMKWVVYLGAVAAIPAVSSVRELPTDVLQGISTVPKRMMEISGEGMKYRFLEDQAFEEAMQNFWHQTNGKAKFVRTVRDAGLQPARRWQDETGRWHDQPESYVTFFQYRRA